MITIKLPYHIENNDIKSIILSYIKQYSNCLHFMYNRVSDGLSETQIKHLNINNIELLDSWFKQSCIKDAIQINNTNKDKKVVFGGRQNFIKRTKNLISKEEYLLNRLSPLYSIGEGSNPSVKSNRKFQLYQDLSFIMFQPNRKTKIQLFLPKLNKNYSETLKQLYLKQEEKNFSITYKLDTKYIYISFDEIILKKENARIPIKNRIMAIDLNPNYIGFSVVDWQNSCDYKIIKSGVFSIKHLNDIEYEYKSLKLSSDDKKKIYLNNKRTYETLNISKKLIDISLYYNVEIFSLEELNIKSSDKKKGKNYNRLVNNNWIREKFYNNLNKRCTIYGINLIKVKPEYSSFIGNIIYRKHELPDMVLSSLEIGRRGYEFYNQYITKQKEIKKNIISPEKEFYISSIIKSLEEFNIEEKFDDLIKLYYFFKKNSNIKYRVSLDSLNLKFLSQNNKKYSLILI